MSVKVDVLWNYIAANPTGDASHMLTSTSSLAKRPRWSDSKITLPVIEHPISYSARRQALKGSVRGILCGDIGSSTNPTKGHCNAALIGTSLSIPLSDGAAATNGKVTWLMWTSLLQAG